MTYEDLMEAIADRISELWPERMLYRDFCPSDFKRPSGFLYVVKAGYTDANAGLVRWDFSAELTLYAATDAYTVESTEALRAEQNKVLRQFGGPAVSVGDRHIMVGVSAEAPGPGEAYVGFRASWFDARPGYVDEDTAAESESGVPLMMDFEIKMDYKPAHPPF